MNRSVTGGGMENEIKQLKTLLGHLAKEHKIRVNPPQDFYGADGCYDSNDSTAKENSGQFKTYEVHNKPPSLPFKLSKPGC